MSADDEVPPPPEPPTGDEPPPPDEAEPFRPTITQPGWYGEMEPDAYHKDPVVGGSVSSSGIRLLLDCPARFKAARDGELDDETEAKNNGSALHQYVLGAGAELYVPQYDGKTNKGKEERKEAKDRGALVVTPLAYKRITRMAEKIREHPTAGELLDPTTGFAEQCLVWRDERTGVMCRALIDFLPHWARTTREGEKFIVPDLKKVGRGDVSPENIGKTIANYGYHIQGEFYDRGVRALGLNNGAASAFTLVAVEEKSPHLVTVAQYTEDERYVANVLIDHALDLYVEAMETGRWPSYSDGIATVHAPPWYLRDFDARHDAGEFAPRRGRPDAVHLKTAS